MNRIFTSAEISSIICISHEYDFLRRNTATGLYFARGTVSPPENWEHLEREYDYRTESPAMTKIRASRVEPGIWQ